MPMGAVYIYRFNFFGGLIVSMAVYYLLCWLKPVPATSSVWCEKGDQADRQFSVVYVEGEDYDEERSTGADAIDVRPAHGEAKTTTYEDKARAADF